MSQEKKMEPRLGPLDVVLYAVILCVHYPLRIAFAAYRLAKAAIVKIVSLPRQCLDSIVQLIFAAEGTLEKKLISIINILATIPSNIFRKVIDTLSYPFTKKETQINNDIKTDTTITENNYLGLIWTLMKQLLVASINILEQILLIPVKIFSIPLKIGKTAIETMFNVVKSTKPLQKKERKNATLLEHALDFVILLVGVIQYYLKRLTGLFEKFIFQLFEFICNIPRQLLDLVKVIYTRCAQAVIVYFIFIYNLGRYFLFYALYLLNRIWKRSERKVSKSEKPSGRNKSKTATYDADLLLQENSKLKETLAAAQQKNATHKCDQQIKDLQKQLNDVQLGFDKERQQYNREIEKLKRDINQNRKERVVNDFNSERGKLQTEIQKLQDVIAEVQKENEEENRIKKQEAIDLDNERNQLQEQIQKLQQQVVTLQKQHETNALRFDEYRKQIEINFEMERQQLKNKVQTLQQKLANVEHKQSFDGDYKVVDDDKTKSTDEISTIENNINVAGKNSNKKKRY